MKFAIVLNLDRFSEETPITVVWERLLEMLTIAEDGGFEMAFTAEHHTIETTIAPNPFQVLAHWAAHTKRIRLGTGVVSASYWHPIRLAGEAALCDIITGGRLELGIGRGSYQYEFDRMRPGIDQREGVAFMKELMPAVRALWRGDYAHSGEYWQFPTTTSVPKPLQSPEPPIWVAARDPGTFDWAVASGMNIMSTPLHAPHKEVEALMERFETTVARHPHVPRPKMMMLRRTSVYESAADWEVPITALTNYGRYFENLLKNVGTVRNGFPEPVDYSVVANKSDYAPESLLKNMMFGTPDEVIRKLRAYEALGIDYFLYGASFGQDYETMKRSLQLFTRHVMPAFSETNRTGGPASNAGRQTA
ncbi:LLM class flavin-dependent oxidoreductase [Mycoplana dimorpha]|uniref:Alkanesulfonate monooxygenase SsuD/methylene tetrahydromethanopterin reductase-like flavin-dependent oxidoreductase (Luciferase family) n=1 Tax=Mycoplana dimorpha TaxID=28320 RepID=A0A2T5BAW3_MYCDI|nr:LLM class flavin-dependent oxidoreductase [Mycoplana dimorpha]PTM96130.1 alkanesulfonate monooxygenase SsuD/methylene tetrahydromethanopterin reductase-like flavin-dependent oxidoreductase (luciferase family) [Mycoplana dimorpha]